MANGENGGRDGRGRFGKGNQAAVGRAAPHAAKVAALRAALLSAVTEEDVQAIAKALIEKARNGDLRAARELLDRVLGAPDKVTWSIDNLAVAEKTALAEAEWLEWHGLSEAERLLRSIGRPA